MLLAAIRRGDRGEARRSINRVLVHIYSAGEERSDLLKGLLLELVAMISNPMELTFGLAPKLVTTRSGMVIGGGREYPMAMEGKTSACAHLSPMGILAAACCDTWSNESVQNIKLLGGMAPTCYLEQLGYDCRLMNTARSHGRDSARQLQRWLVESDMATDPQAFIIAPESSVQLAQAIVASDSHYHAGVAVAHKAVELLHGAYDKGKLRIAPN